MLFGALGAKLNVSVQSHVMFLLPRLHSATMATISNEDAEFVKEEHAKKEEDERLTKEEEAERKKKDNEIALIDLRGWILQTTTIGQPLELRARRAVKRVRYVNLVNEITRCNH